MRNIFLIIEKADKYYNEDGNLISPDLIKSMDISDFNPNALNSEEYTKSKPL